LQLSITNSKTGQYVTAAITKSAVSNVAAVDNFNNTWNILVQGSVTVTEEPTMAAPAKDKDWDIISGSAPFTYSGSKGIVLQLTATGYGKVVSVVTMINGEEFKDVWMQFLGSLELAAPPSNQVGNTNTTPPADAAQPVGNGRFQFTTTNFDDGWTSVVKSDWVEVTRGTIKVLLHYPNADIQTKGLPQYSKGSPEYSISSAWNVLVAPRYSNLKGYKQSYTVGYLSQYFATATLTDNATGRSVYVLLFSANNGWIECIAADKNAFMQEFKFDPETIGSYSSSDLSAQVSKMAGYNHFSLGAADLDNSGKWSNNFANNTSYVNTYTGSYAGMNTYTSSEVFQFGKNNTYIWNLSSANSFGGATNVIQSSGKGSFKLVNNGQLQFSDMGGKPGTYDAYFSAIKNGRILWLRNAAYPGSGNFTAYAPVK
jgi:hypothetical protein